VGTRTGRGNAHRTSPFRVTAVLQIQRLRPTHDITKAIGILLAYFERLRISIVKGISALVPNPESTYSS
jgi:hypothetical protein